MSPATSIPPRVLVRPLAADDRGAWTAMFQAYATFYRASVAAAVIDQTFERALDGRDGMAGFVAVDDGGVPVGFALAVFHRSSWSPSWYCYLEDLFVEPSVRGSGYGRALIEAVYAEADRRGATRTYWATETANDAARRLYDSVAMLAPFVQYRR